MKISLVRDIAKSMGMKTGKMGRTELIRRIQREEGNHACFATPYVRECDQLNCLWREDCLKEDLQAA